MLDPIPDLTPLLKPSALGDFATYFFASAGGLFLGGELGKDTPMRGCTHSMAFSDCYMFYIQVWQLVQLVAAVASQPIRTADRESRPRSGNSAPMFCGRRPSLWTKESTFQMGVFGDRRGRNRRIPKGCEHREDDMKTELYRRGPHHGKPVPPP